MSDPSASPALDRRDLLVAAALGVATLGLYAQTLGFDFVSFDDPQYVVRNPSVREGLGLEGIRWAFGSASFGTWNPLTWLSHMLAVELFGLAPAGHHAANAVLHALNGVLLFVLLRRLTGARARSAAAAALFAFHPLHVESVAWVSERKDVLSTCLGLLAIGAYASYARRPSLPRHLGVAALFAASLMSKPMLVTLPGILLLLDDWPLRRPLAARLLLEKLPLLALSIGCGVIALFTQNPASVALLPLSQRVANALWSYVAYLRKTLWPVAAGDLNARSGSPAP